MRATRSCPQVVGVEVVTRVFRRSTVKALTPCRLMSFTAATLQLTTEMQQAEYAREVLPQMPLFRAVDEATMQALLPLFAVTEVAGSIRTHVT